MSRRGDDGRGAAQNEGGRFGFDGGRRDNSHSARQNASGEFSNARLSDVRQAGNRLSQDSRDGQRPQQDRNIRNQDSRNQEFRNRDYMNSPGRAPQEFHQGNYRAQANYRQEARHEAHLPNLQIDARVQAHARAEIDFNPTRNQDRDRGRGRDRDRGDDRCPPPKPEPCPPKPPKPEPPCPPKPPKPEPPCPPKPPRPEPPCPPKPPRPEPPRPPKPEPPCPPKPPRPEPPCPPKPPRPEPPCPPERPPHYPYPQRPEPCEPYPQPRPPWQGPDWNYPPIPPIDCGPRPRPDCNPLPPPPCNGPIEWYPPVPEFPQPAPPIVPPLGGFDFSVSISAGGSASFGFGFDTQAQYPTPIPTYEPPQQWEYPQQPQVPSYDYPAQPRPNQQLPMYPPPAPQQPPAYDYPAPPRPQPQVPSYDYPAPPRPPQNEVPQPTPQPFPPPEQPFQPQELPYQPPEFNPSVDSGDATIGSFPPRSPNAMTGSEFFTQVLGANPNDSRVLGVVGQEREAAIIREIEAGNIPDFLRHPKTVRIQDSQGNTAEFQVLPDYLAIGSNEDYVRVPLTPAVARAIANKYGFDLPTEKLCKAIYNQPDAERLTGHGLVNDRSDANYMAGNGFALRHDSMIDRDLRNVPPGTLVAGHKKDIILSNFAKNNPDRLDYYGLYRSTGTPIQGSGGGAHEVTYQDYSHGARLVSQRVIVNGTPMSYEQLLKDPRYAHLATDEGSLDASRIYR